MKAAQLTPAATPVKKSNPFFSKGGKQDFFHGSSINEQPFFSKSKNNNYGIQTKLTVGAPNDVYEKEADSMADKVVQRLAQPEVRSKKDTSVQAKPLSTSFTPFVQKKCAHCEEEEKLQKEKEHRGKERIQKKPIFESDAEPPDDSLSFGEGRGEAILRKCAACEKEEKLQKKSNESSQATPSNIESRLSSSKGAGSTLPAATREQMENSFGADFSTVRIHNDSSAVRMSKDLNAHAFTHGSDIYFNSGKYDSNSKSGKHLLAHELTHVVQQGEANTPNVQGDFWDDAKGYYNSTADTVVDAGKAIYQQGSDIITSAAGTASEVGKSLYQRGETIVSSVEEKAKTAVDWAKQKADAALNTVTEVGTEAYNSAKGQANETSIGALEDFKKGFDLISDIKIDLNSRAAKAIIAWLRQLSPNIIDQIRAKSPITIFNLVEIPGDVQEAASELGNFARNDIIPGGRFDPNGNPGIRPGLNPGLKPGLSPGPGVKPPPILVAIIIFIIIMLIPANVFDSGEEDKELKRNQKKEEEKRKIEEEDRKKKNEKEKGKCRETIPALRTLLHVIILQQLDRNADIFVEANLRNTPRDRQNLGDFFLRQKFPFLFFKIKKVTKNTILKACSLKNNSLATSNGNKHIDESFHAEELAAPLLITQLKSIPIKERVGGTLFNVCQSRACVTDSGRNPEGCTGVLEDIKNKFLPGGQVVDEPTGFPPDSVLIPASDQALLHQLERRLET